MGANVLSIHLESLLMVNASITKPDGTVLVLSNPEIEGTTYKLSTQVNSFSDNDVGNYICNAKIRPTSSAVYLTGMGQLVSNPFKIVIGIKVKEFMN
jgi:DNA-binding beta-propeller fold protein YncE